MPHPFALFAKGGLPYRPRTTSDSFTSYGPIKRQPPESCSLTVVPELAGWCWLVFFYPLNRTSHFAIVHIKSPPKMIVVAQRFAILMKRFLYVTFLIPTPYRSHNGPALDTHRAAAQSSTDQENFHIAFIKQHYSAEHAMCSSVFRIRVQSGLELREGRVEIPLLI